jgi:hypothetical protein
MHKLMVYLIAVIKYTISLNMGESVFESINSTTGDGSTDGRFMSCRRATADTILSQLNGSRFTVELCGA